MYSPSVSIPSSSVSSDTPVHAVSNFDHFVTQWMSLITISAGSAVSSSQVHEADVVDGPVDRERPLLERRVRRRPVREDGEVVGQVLPGREAARIDVGAAAEEAAGDRGHGRRDYSPWRARGDHHRRDQRRPRRRRAGAPRTGRDGRRRAARAPRGRQGRERSGRRGPARRGRRAGRRRRGRRSRRDAAGRAERRGGRPGRGPACPGRGLRAPR